LMQDMADSTTYWSPTLQVLQMSARAHDRSFREDPRLKYIPFILNEGIWKGDANKSAERSIDGNGRNIDAEMYQLAKNNLMQAHQSGVKLLAGTDAGDTYVFPGFSIHREIEEYVAAGISPQDTLKIATIEAARFSKLDGDYGSIEAGKVADILLLRANPYTDIRNTQKIEGLFLGGRYFDRSALDNILDFAERQAGSIRLNLRYLWDALSSPLMRVQLVD
ncbi:MAG: amidohydrolase family protein, partial [Sphingomonas bacterium]|nr:amidohydrolase family protein [Sphingomonas bacterium]